MINVGRNLWKSNLPAQAQTSEQVAQDHFQAAFEGLQEGRLIVTCRQAIPVLHHPHNKVLPDFQIETLELQFVSIVFCPGTGHHQKEPGSGEDKTITHQIPLNQTF